MGREKARSGTEGGRSETQIEEKRPRRPQIRLLQVVGRLNIGGPAVQVLLLEKGLRTSPDYVTRLVTGRVEDYEGNMGFLAEELGVQPVWLPELGRELSPLQDVLAFFRLLEEIWRFRPTIIHTHASKGGALGRLAALLYKAEEHLTGGKPCKIVHTFHGHVLSGYFSRPWEVLFRRIERFLARFTDCLIVLSETLKTQLAEVHQIGKPEKYRVVPVGVNLTPFLQDANSGDVRKELAVSPDTILVGIIGRLTPVKNHAMFLRALRLLKEAEGDGLLHWKAIIVGDGELRQDLMQLTTALGLHADLVFLGWRKDMLAIYSTLDIVCLTSINEGTPLCAIEALAAGKPVVATDVGGVSDIVKHGTNGYLVPSGSEAALRDRLFELINDCHKRTEFGKAGRSHALEHYAVEKLIANLDTLYRDLIAHPPH